VERLGLDTPVDAVADQRGQRQAGQRVQGIQDQPGQQRDQHRPQQLAQREPGRGCPGVRLVHPRQVPGGRQRLQLRVHPGAEREAAQHAVPVGAPVRRHRLRRHDRALGLLGGVGVLDVLGVVVRAGQQQPVARAAPDQLVVGAHVLHPALVQHGDPVGELQGGPAVRDQQRGPAAHHPAQRLVDLRL
jgi:hypothetical protein